jgi:hypothetical protein
LSQQTTPPQAPREFWIGKYTGAVMNRSPETDAERELAIHVIEYSAYDQLAGEIERLKGLLADHETDWERIQDAEREVERLKKQVSDSRLYAQDLERENVRLRGALEKIRDSKPHSEGEAGLADALIHNEIVARAALAGDGKGE